MTTPNESAVGAAIAELAKVQDVLNEDTEAIAGWAGESGGASQAARRSFIRAAFALIEGVTFAMKQEAVAAAKTFGPELFSGRARDGAGAVGHALQDGCDRDQECVPPNAS